MPEAKTLERAHRDKKEGKSASTQAGEFVREEIDHIRAGKHGARSSKQAIAIGLSKARRAGVKLAPPKKDTKKRKQSSAVRKQAARDLRKGAKTAKAPSRTRSRATENALKREGHAAASRAALARQARASAGKRGAAARQKAGRKAAATRKRAQSR